jgi:hypothetical protein
MATRSGMAALITRVRAMIADPAGGSQQFADQDVQDVLDDTRTVVRYGQLQLQPTLSAGGILSYQEYFASYGDWEDSPGTQLYGPAYALLSPSASDTITGHWSFSVNQPFPVFVVGNFFDRYAAAADLCERWAAFLSRDYDFSTGNQRFSRSQAAKGMLTMAATYRERSYVTTRGMQRSDFNHSTGQPLPAVDITNWGN